MRQYILLEVNETDLFAAGYEPVSYTHLKHYNVAITHAAKKLVRLIYAMEKSGMPYIKTA